MIPSTNNKLFVAEDWKKIYQSFANVDFKSYDFETLRRTMIAYLRENYPEDFNDYIDSSEYVALIDLIAYLGQNLSFRVDLNARENFLETAQRRESILRLAQLINYNPKRNVPANGLLKVTSVVTSENVFDSNGINLANTPIAWNDPSNANWYQQFLTVLNAAMPSNVVFGKPYDKKSINGVETELYKISAASTDVPVYSFTKSIGGTSMPFEITSCSILNKEYVYEATPVPGADFGFIFKNDARGSSSANTGFFLHFRQGTINASNFSIDTPTANEVIGVDVSGINDTDVWLWQLDNNGNYATEWIKVPSIVGNNIIYNSLDVDKRNIYAVTTRDQDQVDLNFADGSFGNLPKGNFRLFYRQSNGLQYSIKPDQMNGIQVQIPYLSKSGQRNNLTLTLSLQYTVNNSAATESNENIKLKAPQTYYTQNRMITAEDYNIAPLSVGTDILKVKAVNRVASGISKYFELTDVSGKYSGSNIFGSDGVLYKDQIEPAFDFSFSSRNEIYNVLVTQLGKILSSNALRNFYYDKFPRPSLEDPGVSWTLATFTTNQSTGYFKNRYTGIPLQVGYFTGNNLTYVETGALIKFVPPTRTVGNVTYQQYFSSKNGIVQNQGPGTKDYIWVRVVNTLGDGTNGGAGTFSDGTGPIIFSSYVPNGAIATQVIPAFDTSLSFALQSEIINLCLSNRNFGISFDNETRNWYVINDTDLNLNEDFSLVDQKDTSNSNLDSSWLFAFTWNGVGYDVRYRITEYLFESENETGFFYDGDTKNFDFVKNTVVKDKISVLGINTKPVNLGVASTYITVASTTTNGGIKAFSILNSGTGHLVSTPSITVSGGTGGEFIPILKKGNIQSIRIVSSGTGYSVNSVVSVTLTDTDYSTSSLGLDYDWQIDGAVVESDGYVQPKKVKVSFFDSQSDGAIDNPDSFEEVVDTESIDPNTGYKNKFVFFKKNGDAGYKLVSSTDFYCYPTMEDIPNSELVEGRKYYFYDPTNNYIASYSTATSSFFTLEPDYYAKPGRKGLKFHYSHNSGDNRRIDPSKTNIIDVFMLSSNYDKSFRSWLLTGSGTQPLPPTSSELEENYSYVLEPIKAISDQIIYQPVSYKVLFGPNADRNLQATFKAVKNPARTASENDIRTRILLAIYEFFNLDNWDFGQTFYFSELSTYVMNVMTPDITNFIIVPKADVPFGSLYEIKSLDNEIFVSGVTAADIEVIDAITSNQIKTTATIINSSVGVA